MFVEEMGPNQKGAIAEMAVAAEAAKHGLEVLWPLTEHMRYDLAIDLGGEIVRVQCKWARTDGDVVMVNLTTNHLTPLAGYKRSKYSPEEIDVVIAYCLEVDKCYVLPVELVQGRSSFHLRLTPTRNKQRAAVNSAADYEFTGAVAQLARALRWHRRGRRFESDQLHQPDPDLTTVGAEELGAHTGRFIQRAASGESFLITRRGKPMARLVPPVEVGVDGDLAQPTLLEEPPGAEAA